MTVSDQSGHQQGTLESGLIEKTPIAVPVVRGLTLRSTGVLALSNLLGGVGVASGITVGALLVESLSGTVVAGIGQATTVLGAALTAVPLSRLAVRRGRRVSLSVGYLIAAAGVVLIVLGGNLRLFPMLLAGLLFLGLAQATNLQSRFAATDGVLATRRATAMSVVLWATTVGSVAGPNLTAYGQELGRRLGIEPLTGPYLISLTAFLLSALVIRTLLRPPPQTLPLVEGTVGSAPTLSAFDALRRALGDPRLRLGVTLVVMSQGVMTMVMVMTPLHLQHHGHTVGVTGVIISIHIAGMYLLAPLFGWSVDRFGAPVVAGVGVLTLFAAVGLGIAAAVIPAGTGMFAAALLLLGLGWSACNIAGSAILSSAPTTFRVPLQGGTDAAMNLAAACSAVLAGPLLAWHGFEAVNLSGAVLLLPPAFLLLRYVLRLRRSVDSLPAESELAY